MPGSPPEADEEEGEGTDGLDQPEQAEEPEEPTAARGGDLGAAVTAALEAALERTGELPSAARPTAENAPPTADPAEPMDLLDTSTAPWLADPELGVQWAESWMASHPVEEEPAPPMEAAPAPPEPTAPPTMKSPAPAEPPPAPAHPRPEVTPRVEAAASPPPPAPPPPAAPLPPPTRPYEPRSLEVMNGSVPAPAPTRAYAPSAPLDEERLLEAAMRRARHVEAPRSGGGRLIAFGLLVGLVAGLVAYAVGPAARDVFVTRYIVPVSDLPVPLQGLRVMQVSDLHLPRNPEAAQAAARLVADAKPDVLLLTGDILDDESPPALAALDAFLGTARSTRGTFAIAGERELDFSASLASAYERHKVQLLTGDRATVNVNGASLVINGFAGSPGALRELKPVAFVPGRLRDVDDLAKRQVEIWMVHAPQLVGAIPRDELKNIAFIVAGHTLGGPLGIPPLISPSRYRSGWYTVDRTHLYVSNGVGTGRLPARLLAPAEVAVFTLRRAAQPYAIPQRE